MTIQRAPVIALAVTLAGSLACSAPGTTTDEVAPGAAGETVGPDIDERSYQLGVISAFSEVVRAGVKRLALSAPLEPGDMDALLEDAAVIAAQHDVKTYVERDLLVTDLFPASTAEGRHVLLMYRDAVLDEYRALEARKAALVAAGEYAGDARRQLAIDFGRLLSYPDERIQELLAGNTELE